MKETINKIRVFVASPGDVAAERNQLSKVIQEINFIITTIAPEKKIFLELIRWETHVHPNLGRDAQAVVFDQLSDFDIFIGIMWKRFGTPTTDAGSGTESEFNLAYSKWEKNNNFPVLFYFCQSPISMPDSEEDAIQLSKVLQFKKKLETKGLIWQYADQNSFADTIRQHLILVLSRMLSKETPVSAAEKVNELTTENDITVNRELVKSLTEKYVNLRKVMPAGEERTRLMTIIETEMRANAMQIFPLLSELVNSSSPGDRLAAIATLKEIPDPKYLTWLAKRVGDPEKPFIGFHASVGLLTAVRELGTSHKKEVEAAVNLAIENLDKSNYKDPNQVSVLQNAMKKLLQAN